MWIKIERIIMTDAIKTAKQGMIVGTSLVQLEKPASQASIHYLVEGPAEGRPVLLMHGLGSDATSWQIQVPALTGLGMRVFAVDVPGFGQSRHKGGRWSIAYIAQCLAQFCRQELRGRADVVGISMGGVIALQMGLDYPELVERLVLVNTFAALHTGGIRQWGYFLRRAVLLYSAGQAAQARFVARRIFPGEDQGALRQILIEQIMQADLGDYRRAMVSLALFDARSRLAGVRPPVLVVTGERDNTVLPAVQAEMVGLIPGARQELVAGAGHAVIVDQPEAFNRVLCGFLG